MSTRSRLGYLLGISLLSLGAALPSFPSTTQGQAQPAPSRKDEQVYRYRNREGREVFTNAGSVLVNGAPPLPLLLPELQKLDFDATSPALLRQLDQGVERAHEQMQGGERCEAIRASLRVPTRTFVLREHLREILVAGVLLAVGLLVVVGWSGRLRLLMPLAPVMGAAFLAYSTFGRVDRRMDALREGLRACSSELPAAAGVSPSSVKQRLESATSLQATIDRAYAQRAQLAEQMLRER